MAHGSGMDRWLGEGAEKNGTPMSSCFRSSMVNTGRLAGSGDLFAARFTAELVVTRDGAVASQDFHLAEYGLVSEARLLYSRKKSQRNIFKWRSEDLYLLVKPAVTSSTISNHDIKMVCK